MDLSNVFEQSVLSPCYALLKNSMDKPRKEMTTKFVSTKKIAMEHLFCWIFKQGE